MSMPFEADTKRNFDGFMAEVGRGVILIAKCMDENTNSKKCSFISDRKKVVSFCGK